MNVRRLTGQESDSEVAGVVVLVCTACQHTWEPDLLDPTDRFEAASTGCPLCGGWTWIGQITEPGDSRMQSTNPPAHRSTTR